MNRQAIREFIKSEFPVSKTMESFNDDTSLIENGIVDSLGIQSVVAFLEKEFAIQVSDMDLLPENFNSVNALAVYVEGKIS